VISYQLSGVGRQEAGGRRQEAGGRRQEAGGSFILLTPYTLHPTPYTLHPTPHHPSQALLFNLDGVGGIDGRGGTTRGDSLTVLTIKTISPSKKAFVGAIIG